jgi:hypothetical protein
MHTYTPDQIDDHIRELDKINVSLALSKLQRILESSSEMHRFFEIFFIALSDYQIKEVA